MTGKVDRASLVCEKLLRDDSELLAWRGRREEESEDKPHSPQQGEAWTRGSPF